MTIAQSIINQMWIYCASLKTLQFCGLCEKYSKQVDLIIDNLNASANMLLIDAKVQQKEVQILVNVSKS